MLDRASVLLGVAVAFATASAVLGSAVPDVEIAPGVKMPMLAFGSGTQSYIKKECTVQDAVAQWLQVGGRHIDTAYGTWYTENGTQPDVGKAMKASGVPRKDIFLTTKIPGPIGKQEAIDLILKQSLPQLGVDYIDLVLIHFPCSNKSLFPNRCGHADAYKRLPTFDGLLELKKAGKIRAVGVSNYDQDQVAELIYQGREAPAVNQVQWHLGYHDEELLQAMKAIGTTLAAWGALAGPCTKGRTDDTPGVSLSDPRLKAVAARYNASTAQVALRWSVHKGVVPVTSTCSEEHAVGDLSSFAFDLSEDDVAYLDAMKPQPASPILV